MATVVLHAGIAGGTLVTVRSSDLKPTELERTTFDAGHESITQGRSANRDPPARRLANG